MQISEDKGDDGGTGAAAAEAVVDVRHSVDPGVSIVRIV